MASTVVSTWAKTPSTFAVAISNSARGFAPLPIPPPRTQCEPQDGRGLGPGSVPRRASEDCAGKAGARTASITSHEVVSERLSMMSLGGAALERVRQDLLHLDDGERGHHADEAEKQDEEPREGGDGDGAVGHPREEDAPGVGVEVVAQPGDDDVEALEPHADQDEDRDDVEDHGARPRLLPEQH